MAKKINISVDSTQSGQATVTAKKINKMPQTNMVPKLPMYPVDSIIYTGQNGSERRSNTIDFINENRQTLTDYRNQGMLNEDAVNTLMQNKGAIKVGKSKKYDPLRYSTTPRFNKGKIGSLPKYAKGIPGTNQTFDINSATNLANPQYDWTMGATKAPTAKAPGMSTSSIIGGAANVATGIGELIKNDDASSAQSYAGNILSETGKYAGMGAALGPLGAAGGAAIGAGIGIYESINADKAQQKAEEQMQINKEQSANQSASQAINAKYNLRNTTNNRVPGLNKGTPKFKDENPGMTGMMKARMAFANEFGNPSAKRMVSSNPDAYKFTGNEVDAFGNTPKGDTGTHYMSSFDNYAVPSIQKINNKMSFINGIPPASNEDIKFDRPEDAEYFAEHYKEIAPMMKSNKFNKGGVNIRNANAMVANEEGLLNPNTGRVETIQGKYNSSNPDVVPVVLPDGASVYSKSKIQTIPGGKSTPADIIAKAESMQKLNDKILYPKQGSRKLDKLSRLTAEINQKNIQYQAENLNMYNSLINPQPQSTNSIPKFDTGTPNFSVQQKIYNGKVITDADMATMTQDQLNKITTRIITGNEALATSSNNGQFLAGNVISDDGKVNISKNNVPVIPQSVNAVTVVSKKPVLSPSKALSTNSGTSVPVRNRMSIITPNTASRDTKLVTDTVNALIPNQQVTVQPDPSTGMAIAGNPGALKVPSAGYSPSDFHLQPKWEDYSDPFTYIDKTNTGPVDASQTTTSSVVYNPSVNNKIGTPSSPSVDTNTDNTGNTGNTKDVSNTKWYDGLGTLGNKLMSLAPFAYNAANATPEVEKPIYEDYINPTQRYNIAPQLAEQTKQRRISRSNQANLNTNTGANMAFAANEYATNMGQTAELMNTAEQANAGYRSQYADRYNKFTSQRAGEDRRISDINARNRAAARTMKAKNAEMISQYAQTQQLMGNQANSDLLNTNIWGAYASAVDEKTKKMIMNSINDTRRRQGLPIYNS